MERHHIERIRHETRRRTLTVETINRLTPRMLRINFHAPDLKDFVSASADDHIKLFFPTDDDPQMGGGARPGGRSCMRDFTPRSFDVAQGKLVIDFALHEAGLATMWASAAKVGDTLEIGGPRGSAVIPADFDWYLLIGDETALPAIGRRVEELRPDVSVRTLVAIASPDDAQTFETRAAWAPVWCVRDGATDDAAMLRAALEIQASLSGDGFAWIAAEAGVARALRTYMIENRQHPREWIKAAGYWTRGQADAHLTIEDQPDSNLFEPLAVSDATISHRPSLPRRQIHAYGNRPRGSGGHIMVRTQKRLRNTVLKLTIGAFAFASFGAAVVAAPYMLSPKTEMAKSEIGELQPLAGGPAIMLAKAAPGESEDCVRVTRVTGPDGAVYPTRGVVCSGN